MLAPHPTPNTTSAPAPAPAPVTIKGRRASELPMFSANTSHRTTRAKEPRPWKMEGPTITAIPTVLPDQYRKHDTDLAKRFGVCLPLQNHCTDRMNYILSVHVANKAANHQPETSSDESEDESLKSADGDQLGEVMLTHPTPLSISIPHNSVLEQGVVATVTVPPPPETISPSENPDKTVQPSDKSVQPSPKAKTRKRALSQPTQRRNPRPLDFVSTSASQPEVYMLQFCVLHSAKPDSLFRGLLLAQAPHVHNVIDVLPPTSKYPRTNNVCYPSLAFFHVFHT
jgi:hypothetical protein